MNEIELSTRYVVDFRFENESKTRMVCMRTKNVVVNNDKISVNLIVPEGFFVDQQDEINKLMVKNSIIKQALRLAIKEGHSVAVEGEGLWWGGLNEQTFHQFDKFDFYNKEGLEKIIDLHSDYFIQEAKKHYELLERDYASTN